MDTKEKRVELLELQLRTPGWGAMVGRASEIIRIAEESLDEIDTLEERLRRIGESLKSLFVTHPHFANPELLKDIYG